MPIISYNVVRSLWVLSIEAGNPPESVGIFAAVGDSPKHLGTLNTDGESPNVVGTFDADGGFPRVRGDPYSCWGIPQCSWVFSTQLRDSPECMGIFTATGESPNAVGTFKTARESLRVQGNL
jgi:hypothetical protein